MAAMHLLRDDLLQRIRLQRQERTFRRKICPAIDFPQDSALRERYRFGHDGVNFICGLLEDQLQRPTGRSRSLSVKTQVLLALKFYATGDYIISVGDNVGVSKSTASKCISAVTQGLSGKLDQFVKWPVNFDAVKRGFHEVGGFPNVCGCVDCTHVRIQAPNTPHDWADDRHTYEAPFVNRKNYHSMNIQAICDYECK